MRIYFLSNSFKDLGHKFGQTSCARVHPGQSVDFRWAMADERLQLENVELTRASFNSYLHVLATYSIQTSGKIPQKAPLLRN